MGPGSQHPEVMLLLPSPTLQPKTFPWALVPSSGSKAERKDAHKSPWFLSGPWAHKRNTQARTKFFPQV